jgi:hypothetical protein
MASGFDPRCRVLSFDPRAHVRAGERAYLLWPAWAYHVVAPEAREQTLNFLQKTVLGLCQAGVRTAREVEELLRVALDLAALLLHQLQTLGLIDEQARLTKQGEVVVEEEVLDQPQWVAGYVFQDRRTGELWPRFMEQLHEIDVEAGPGFPLLVTGPTGKRRRVRAFPLEPSDVIPAPPRPEQILRAAWLHRRRLRTSNVFDEPEEGPLGTRVEGAPDLRRVTLIEERPVPVYVTALIYRPADACAGASWMVADPFVKGVNRQLARAVASALETSPELRQFLDSVVPASSGGERSGGAETVDHRAQEAADRVGTLLATDLPRSGRLYERLVALERARLEVLGAAESYDRDKLGGLASRAEQVLKELFTILRQAHPGGESWKVLTGDERHNAELLNAVSLQVGLKTPLPVELLRVKRARVEAAAARGEQSLCAQALAALLAAYQDAKHPLRRAARGFPDILHCVHAIGRMLDEIRAPDGHRDREQDEVLAHVPVVYRIVHAILAHEAPSGAVPVGLRAEPPAASSGREDQLLTRALLRDNTP